MILDCVDFYLVSVGELQLPDEEPFDVWEHLENKERKSVYE